ncbi:MAG: DUF2746 domain-containing protein [Mycobacterium sp.]|nr:DUF2746 domain-containing protein [Mycobacterium sp.]
MTPIDINDPLDLVGLLIVGAVLVMVACLPAWITTRKNRELHGDVAEIKDQTVNDHGERPEQNLRVQMDRIEARQKDAAAQQDRIEARQDDTSADIRGLRKDFGECCARRV